MEDNNQHGGHEQLINVRNRLFHQMFRRMALRYGSHVPYKYRRMLELNLFAKACVFFFVLVFLHFTIFNKSFACLSAELEKWPRNGVLRVEIVHDAPDNYTLHDSYRKQYRDYRRPAGQRAKSTVDPVDETAPLSAYNADGFTPATANHSAPPSTLTPPTSRPDDQPRRHERQFYEKPRDTVRDILEVERVAATDSPGEREQPEDYESEETPSYAHQIFKEFLWDFSAEEYTDHYIIEYSLNNGFLYLRPEVRERFNISVMLKVIDPVKDKCLGSFDRFILEILGYNDVLLSSVKTIIQKENHKGYLLNVMLGEQYRFVYIWTSRLKYIPAFIFMVIFTLVVSMLLRYSHHQIFIFILRLIQNFEMNSRIIFPVAPFITIILSLVGIEEIMTDFFNDTSTAFYTILIVWIADQYDSICCNNPTSKKYWLRFFFLYHYMFYAYHYRFNGHHSQLALFSSWLFILHSMVYFFHHYELPSLENLEAATRLTINNRIQEVTQIRLVYHGQVDPNDLHSAPLTPGEDNVIRVLAGAERMRRVFQSLTNGDPTTPTTTTSDPPTSALESLRRPVDDPDISGVEEAAGEQDPIQRELWRRREGPDHFEQWDEEEEEDKEDQQVDKLPAFESQSADKPNEGGELLPASRSRLVEGKLSSPLEDGCLQAPTLAPATTTTRATTTTTTIRARITTTPAPASRDSIVLSTTVPTPLSTSAPGETTTTMRLPPTR